MKNILMQFVKVIVFEKAIAKDENPTTNDRM